MGRYLEIVDRALSELTENQELTESEAKSDSPTHCEISELSEISPFVQSVDKRSKELQESPDELRRAAEDDWAEESSTPAKLVGFADALAIAQIREGGCIPDNYTAVTNCKRCGPVPVHEGLPPTIEQCVWCMNGLTAPPIPGVRE